MTDDPERRPTTSFGEEESSGGGEFSGDGGDAEELQAMSLLDHLDELRYRIVRSLIALAVTTGVSWFFVEPIFEFLARPIYATEQFEGKRLAILAVTEGFLLYFKVALLCGVFLAAPFLLYQIYAFIAPGLYRRERRMAVPFVVLGTLFFVAGGAFAYFVAFPFAVDFLLEFADSFEAVITGERYFSFLLTVILGLGLMFELPIFVVLLSAMGMVTPGFLLRHFRWAVILIFVAAALITPTPDVVNLLIFALPTLLLYLLGIGGSWVVWRSRRRRAAAEADGEDGPGD